MQEGAINIFSVNRQKIGTSKANDFEIKFNPSLKLDPEMKHELALDSLSMIYSWYNISSDYKNNTTKYSTNKGTSCETITFVNGMYSYSDINDYIHQYMEQKNHDTTDSKSDKQFYINLTFILSTYKVLLSITNDNYWLDLRGTEFGNLIGFAKKNYSKRRSMEQNCQILQNSIYQLNINTNAIKDSTVDGENADTIAVVSTDNLTRSFPFSFEPRRLKYFPLSSHEISSMRIYTTDSKGRPADLNSIDWSMVLMLRSTGGENYIV